VRRRLRPAAEEDRAHDAQDSAADQRAGDDEDRRDPAATLRGRGVFDQCAAQEGAEGRQGGQGQAADGEHRPQGLQVAPAPVERRLVDRAAAQLEGAHGDEERGLDEPVADDEDGDAGQPGVAEERDAAEQHAHVGDGGEGGEPLEMALGGAHHGAQQRRDQAEDQQRVAQRVGVRPQRSGESGPIHARHAVQAELAHRAGEEQADRRRRHGVGVGHPEVEGDDRGLDEEAAGHEGEGDGHQRVRRAAAQGGADLREVQRARAPVDQGDAEEQHQ
jgi:hypothetical protein